ncbi:unnamed protein product [Pseudo-nitzschia multistriata]|uniref:Uncharacterized protein n=1 Tax=Pseudo-nitzschia multistriata TaxID=183589 RepID=A0A448ZQF9_9STRA|nr:unnamed protein product [Pseudo-nitzschia multistriata]
MELSLKAINSLSSDALQLVDEVPTDLDIICPLVNMTEFESYLGVDINGIIETIVDQQYRLKDDIKAQFVVQQSFADRIEIVLTAIESYGDETEKYLMILPGFLLAIGSLVVIAMLGVVLAWRERSSARFQRNMTYIVLPLLILSAVTCWIILMTLALTTIIGTDVCLSSSSDGSPDETILEILETVGNGTEGTTYQTAFTYINQCHGPDPMQVIEDLKSETQKFVDNIWRQVSKIDAVGRADVLQKCGNTQDFQEMLTGARDLAMSLTNMRRELSSLSKTMGCNSIHPIYTQASHEIICTETLSASSYGFIMFLIMFLCVMAMISLRSSWLGNIEEEKVYHDETEVAENMVVDEHEEYLAYISRYKHEWQEYEGFEEDGAVSSSPRSEFHDQGRSGYPDCTEYYYNDEEEEYSSRVSESDISTMDSRIMCIEDEQQKETMPHHLDTLCTEKDEEVSCVSSKIPFTTFSSERMRKDSHILTLPPSDLPPPMNPELYIDHDESTENTPDNWDYSNVGSSPQKSRKKRTKSFFSSSATTAYKAQDEGDDDSHHQDHNLDFVPDFDKFLSHDQHSTGEVEVQLNNI